MENRKTLKLRYSTKDLAYIMDVSYATLRRDLDSNAKLMQRIRDMGWAPYHRFRKEHVLEIFSVLGYPDGYEWYEKQ